jgi:predicted N-acyltransferase
MFVEEMRSTREWEDFLNVTPGGTFYHYLKWKNVIQKSFGHSPLYLTMRSAGGELVGICPGFISNFTRLNVYDSVPYSDYGGPVIARRWAKQASLALLSFLQGFCSTKGIAYAKIRLMDNELVQSFQRSAVSYDLSSGVVEIDLKATPSNFIWNKILSARTRKKIRLVERDGFQAQEARTKSDLRDFYSLYYKNMKYIGAYPHNYQFINNVWDALYPENLRIWIAENRRRIGGMTVFKDRKRTYCSYVGIDREYSGQYSVVPYLLWKEVKKAEEEGCTCVSLGSTSSDPKHPSHIQKTGFGGLFHQQKTVWFPFGSTGLVLIQSRAKALSAWKSIRDFLPDGIESFLNDRLSRL